MNTTANNNGTTTVTLTKKDKIKLVVGGVLCGLGLIKFGYSIGCKHTELCISKGIDALWQQDPALREQMWNALEQVKKSMTEQN